jgi:hypothetical protein
MLHHNLSRILPNPRVHNSLDWWTNVTCPIKVWVSDRADVGASLQVSFLYRANHFINLILHPKLLRQV